MGALGDLWRSERGLLAVIVIVAASVLVGLGAMPVDEWQTFVMGVFVAYAAGKTITGAVQIVASKPAPPAPAPAPPAAVEASKDDAQP